MTGVEILLCSIIGIIFTSSSVPKLRHPRGFVLTVLEYRVLPPSMAYFYGWILPPLELFVALLLLAGTMVSVAACIIALLIISFIVAIISNIARGRDLDCHCFGMKLRRRIGLPLILQDSVLLGAAVAIVLLVPMQNKLESWSVFRVIEPRSYDSFLPFIACLGLAGGITLLLRFCKFKRVLVLQSKLYQQP